MKPANLKNDFMFKTIESKCPVIIKRFKSGKKDVKFQMKWTGLKTNACVGNEKNIAFITGKENNLTVLDFDDEDSIEWFEENIADIDTLKCYYVKTFKGIHLYFNYSKELDILLAKFSKGRVNVIKNIDIRSEGGCIFYGAGYELISTCDKLDDVPNKFIKVLTKEFENNAKVILPDRNVIIDYKSDDNDINIILENLAIERCESYDSWIKVAMCLKNSFGDKYKDVFIEWSKKSKHHIFDLANITSYWDNINKPKENCVTINSLYALLKIDNENMFNQLKSKKHVILNNDGKKMIYNDYFKYMNAITTITEIEHFLASTVKRIINNGKHFYAVKIIDENRIIRWNIVQNFPLGNHDKFYYELPDSTGKMVVTSSTFINVMKNYVEHKVIKNNVVFEPYGPQVLYLEDEDTNINIFPGWKHDYKEDFKVDLASIEPILHHLKKVYCNDDQDLYKYLMGWLASMIQHPEKKLLVALGFYSSEQGAGKNIFWDWFGKHILGILYQYVNNIDTIFSKFSKRFENCLLVILDEVQSGGSAFVLNNQLKSIITQEVQCIEPKGMESYLISDFRNYVFLSNNEHFLKVENSDRRYCLFECNNVYVGNHKYFNKLKDCIDNKDVILNFFHYLIQYDLTGFQIRDFPMTTLRQNAMTLSSPSHIKFLVHVAENIKTDADDPDDTIEYSKQAKILFAEYVDYIDKYEGGFSKLTNTKFGMEITKILDKKKDKGYIYYSYSKIKIIDFLKKYYKNDKYEL